MKVDIDISERVQHRAKVPQAIKISRMDPLIFFLMNASNVRIQKKIMLIHEIVFFFKSTSLKMKNVIKPLEPL